jgi:hypothetical protein
MLVEFLLNKVMLINNHVWCNLPSTFETKRILIFLWFEYEFLYPEHTNDPNKINSYVSGRHDNN